MLYKLCGRCKKPIIHPATYCGNCLPIAEDTRKQLLRKIENRYNQRRVPKYKAFYNYNDWKLLKDKKMMDEEYRCERCRKLVTEVHHIKPIQTKEGWTLRLDYNKLLAVCVDCHNKEHNRFQRKKARK